MRHGTPYLFLKLPVFRGVAVQDGPVGRVEPWEAEGQ